MSGKNALIVWGGWDGHEPEKVAQLFGGILEADGWRVQVSNDLDSFLTIEEQNMDLVVPIWTMGEISQEQSAAVCRAVEGGVGIAGCHGGMCDAFRGNTEWQFMTGGQWVAHPGDSAVKYRVDLLENDITEGLPRNFEVTSEQYYLHVDPGVTVLATTDFPADGVDGPHKGNPCKMPQLWTKTFGKGKVFYFALGHDRAVLESEICREIMRRGFAWAAR